MTKTEKIDLISSNFDGMEKDVKSIQDILKERPSSPYLTAQRNKSLRNATWYCGVVLALLIATSVVMAIHTTNLAENILTTLNQ